MIDYFLGDAFWVLSCPFWNTALVSCSAADTQPAHRRQLYRQLAHRRSVAVLCLLYKIRCKTLHHLYGALNVPVRVTRGAVIAHRFTYAPPRCRTSQYSRTFITFSVSLFNNLSDRVFDGVGLAGFKSRANVPLLT